jgi:deazaflavin-dependent oxidoreductase (nitroreductase family)
MTIEERNSFNQSIIEEFRKNAGVVGGPFAGAPVVLIHTTGAKSGQERVNPLVALPKGDVLYIFASKGGAPGHPDWYFNILANSEVTVEFGAEVYKAEASILSGAERDAIYAEQSALMPQFAEYQEKTKRTIPVIALKRAE